TCPACTGGNGCVVATDCQSGVCTASTCVSDPFFSSVVLLAHMDGSSDSTTFRDEKGHTLNGAGAAKITTNSSKFGGARRPFGQSTMASYVTAATAPDWDLTTGDSTVEMWVSRATASPPATSMAIVSQSPTGGDQQWAVFLFTPGELY